MLSEDASEQKLSSLLKADPIGDSTPAWQEAGSLRTIEFKLQNVPPAACPEFLTITVFSAETKLTRLSLKIDPERVPTKPRLKG